MHQKNIELVARPDSSVSGRRRRVACTGKALQGVGYLGKNTKWRFVQQVFNHFCNCHFFPTFSLTTSENMPKLEVCHDSPNSLHRLTDALNVLIEKSTLQSMYLRSGSCTLRVLCMGVKWMTASAVMLYWSSVHRVLSSQMFRSGHHMAWSDQSMAISERKNQKC